MTRLPLRSLGRLLDQPKGFLQLVFRESTFLQIAQLLQRKIA